MLKRKMIVGMFLLVLSAFVVPAGATDYYVDANDGNDLWNGLYPEKQPGDNNDGPFRTVNRGFEVSQPGDTIYLREGTYREHLEMGKDSNGVYYSKGASAEARITFKGYQDEEARITSMKLANNPADWTHVSGSIYSYDLEPPQIYPSVNKITNCSEDGVPLKLMTAYTESGEPCDLTGPGQWVRNSDGWKLYVWSTDGANPGTHKTEYANFTHAYNSVVNTIHIHANPSDDSNEVDYITFENLVVEGGRHPVLIGADHIELRNCTIRNCYSDAVKATTDATVPYTWGPTHGLVADCNIYYFGEAGIDATGGDYWIIRDNKIHDSVANRGDMPSGSKVNAVMLKLGIEGATVERNEIFNLNCVYGVITLGSSSVDANQAVDVVVKNNIIYDCNAKNAVQFIGTKDCGYYNNLVYNCSFSQAVIVSRLGQSHPDTINKNLSIKGDIFYNNTAEYGSAGQLHWTFWEYQSTATSRSIDNDFELDYSVIDTSQDYDFTYLIAGANRSLSEVRSLFDYEVHSIEDEPTFVNVSERDFHPFSNSPQVDTGDPDEPDDPKEYNPYDPEATDFDGLLRAYDGDGDSSIVVDIGPYEYSPRVFNIDKGAWYSSIQDAVDEATDGHEIVVYLGTYYESVDFGGKAITVRSIEPCDWDVVAATIIDANDLNANAVMFASGEDANTALRGLTVMGASVGVYVDSVGPVISRCILQSNRTGVKYTQKSTGTLIVNNKIHDSSGYGIFGHKGNASIKSNWIYDSDKGIKFTAGASADIYNNTIVNNISYGIEKGGGQGQVTISNCIIWDCNDDLSGCSATYSCISDCNDAEGVGNICGDANDPLFVDEPSDDYHLESNSPCIDVGDPNGSYTGEVDIDGDDRVIDVFDKGDGNVDVDMGADEYDPNF